ncbi:transcriptional regulator, LacI family [Pseudozobellia thermophila]|uniref:Transcriptional regulator, LacI family n=2 Tax=Pseudozobellia thermophila TaxID=192903 RepID=A0A1M6LGL0_9FLAO|nr:transcriptional regulator, LacI family [Pseudozobellia thermophila]
MAGVSKGTVDRVLHKRGKVSKEAHKKVNSVLNEIDFQPNPIARTLKKNKIYRICVLMPDCRIDPYWKPAEQGIREAINEFKPFGVLVDKFLYHPHERQSFESKSKEILASKPDVVLMAPLFQDESLKILKECRENKIRTALFNNYINTLNDEVFVGQDLYQSGKVAGGLIDKAVRGVSKVAIVHIDKEAHMQLKENGFMSYFEERGNEKKQFIIQSFESSDQRKFNCDVLHFLRQNPDISAIFITNSKAHRFIEVLQQKNTDIAVVGYDLLKENISYLRDGQIEFLIHQKPKRQAYLGISYFAEFFLFGKRVPQRMLLPIDIVTSENVDYYLEE